MSPMRFRELYKLSGACFRKSRMRVFPITPKSEACELKLSRFARQNVWSRSSRHSRSGFTLMEMLLVAAILMILMTLSLPVIVRTKGRGLQLECLSQLRQAGIGFVSYAQDHGDRFPFQVPMKKGARWSLFRRPAKLTTMSSMRSGTFRRFPMSRMSQRFSVAPSIFGRRPERSPSSRTTTSAISWQLQPIPPARNHCFLATGTLWNPAANPAPS